ncbi:hypothetical protein NEUTE2DRAFT_49369, partial [Neurospora tetrasperma FGSC 2509]
ASDCLPLLNGNDDPPGPRIPQKTGRYHSSEGGCTRKLHGPSALGNNKLPQAHSGQPAC